MAAAAAVLMKIAAAMVVMVEEAEAPIGAVPALMVVRAALAAVVGPVVLARVTADSAVAAAPGKEWLSHTQTMVDPDWVALALETAAAAPVDPLPVMQIMAVEAAAAQVSVAPCSRAVAR
jgi:hypothetical protein